MKKIFISLVFLIDFLCLFAQSPAIVVINSQTVTPPTPFISQNGIFLTSNSSTGNQWYTTATGLIPGATGQTYTITADGDFYVIVTINGCASIPSNTISFNSFAQRNQDSLALVVLYNSLGGPNWTDNTNWLSSEPISRWDGITITNNRVSSIFLASNNLTGSIPQQIGDLTNLKFLDLSYNQITGSIPSEIGNLTNLIRLILYNNQLTGIIPVEICNLTKLTNLELYNNQLSGPIPQRIGNMTNLVMLILFHNQLTGSIPAEIGNLANLERLYLQNNLLTGSIPSQIGNLTKLDELFLSNNQLNGTIPIQIGNLVNLIGLILSDNQLTGTIPLQIGELLKLGALVLDNNQLSGTIPTQIGNLTQLGALSLMNNQFTGSIPSEILNLTQLGTLALSQNHLTGPIPSQIGNLTNLLVLRLSNNQFSGTIPTQIENLIYLSILDLSNNQLSGVIPSQFWNLQAFQQLFLNNNQLKGSIPPEIGMLAILHDLSVSHNQFTGSIPIEINNLNRLSSLNLSNNSFEELPAITLGVLDSLCVQSNHFTFEDLEPNSSAARRFYSFSPQDSIGISTDTVRNVGEDFKFEASCGGTYNQYQWYKNNILLPSATSTTYTIPSLQKSDEGVYICAITNTVVIGLTIYSRPIKLHVSTITGKEDIKNQGINIYPNPTRGIIYVDIDKSLSIKSKILITDVYGRSVFIKDFEDAKRQELDLSYLSKGLYFLHINNAKINYFQKIIIK